MDTSELTEAVKVFFAGAVERGIPPRVVAGALISCGVVELCNVAGPDQTIRVLQDMADQARKIHAAWRAETGGTA